MPVTWTDRDRRLLHANFQLLKDFIDKEQPYEWFDTEDSHRKEEWLELKDLYQWWEGRRLLEDEADDQYEVDNKMLVRLIALRHLMWT